MSIIDKNDEQKDTTIEVNANEFSNENVTATTGVRKRKLKRMSPLQIFLLVLFSLYTLSLIVPFVWTILNSLKDKYEYLESVVALPKDWLFSNYIEAFKVLEAGDKNVFLMLGNSLWLALGTPTINILTAATASYVMAKYKFPGRDLIWGIMITIMIIPIYGSTASTYTMYRQLGIFDSPLILISKICGIGGSMMLIAAFEGVSKTYMEAAFLDGAGHFRVFWQIMLPQVTGLLSALWIMSFITEWNAYMYPIMYLPSYVTLSSGLYIYQVEQGRKLNTPILFAGAILCIIPVIILFVAFQDKFLNMSYGGGIKG